MATNGHVSIAFDMAPIDNAISQLTKTLDPMKELYEQHPRPWTVDDNREGNEGSVIVYDARGTDMMFTGDMESCTYADMLLARLIAAAPDLLAACKVALRAIPEHDPRRAEIAAAVAKATQEPKQ